MELPSDANERLWSHVNKNGPLVYPELGQCWIWTGYMNRRGYGAVSLGSRQFGSIAVHRLSLLLAGVDITGKNVCHRCDNPPCVRAAHLYAGSQAQNMADRSERGHFKKGSVPADIVLAIRRDRSTGIYASELALRYGISLTATWSILRGDTYAYLPMLNESYEESRREKCKNGHVRAIFGYRDGGSGRRRCRQCVKDNHALEYQRRVARKT